VTEDFDIHISYL